MAEKHIAHQIGQENAWNHGVVHHPSTGRTIGAPKDNRTAMWTGAAFEMSFNH